MRIIIPSKLNQVTFEKVIKDVNESNQEKVELDLSKLMFIEPYGLVGLVSVIRFLYDSGRKFDVISPGWANPTHSYLKRMGLYSAIEEYLTSIFNKPTIINSRLTPLLEVTKLDFRNGIDQNFINIGDLLYKRLETMLSGDNGDESGIAGVLITSILEICQNIEHSQSYGFVAAQKYGNWNNAVKVGVMDLGIGIKGSLKPKYKTKVEKFTNRKALELAILPNYTSRPSNSGGFGLVTVRKFILNNPGCDFSLRSGKIKYIISESGKEKYLNNLDYFPGTQVSMTFRLRG